MDYRELRDRQLSVCFRKSHYPDERFAARAIRLYGDQLLRQHGRTFALVPYACACRGGWCIGRRTGEGVDWELEEAVDNATM